jgi:hypothetical protein
MTTWNSAVSCDGPSWQPARHEHRGPIDGRIPQRTIWVRVATTKRL